jgi:glucan phosphorylase
MMTTATPASAPATVAYFSMEVGLESAIPTYSGGLGVLAGDALRGAADLGIPMVGIERIFQAAAALDGQVRVLYLEEYDMALARSLTSGKARLASTP